MAKMCDLKAAPGAIRSHAQRDEGHGGATTKRGAKFASFAKFGNKIANLATLNASASDRRSDGGVRRRDFCVYASGFTRAGAVKNAMDGANGTPAGAVNDFHDILCAKETESNAFCIL